MLNKISKNPEDILNNTIESNNINYIISSLTELRSSLAEEIHNSGETKKDISEIKEKLDIIIERIANIESMMRENIIHIGL